jgi:hypothetical protein
MTIIRRMVPILAALAVFAGCGGSGGADDEDAFADAETAPGPDADADADTENEIEEEADSEPGPDADADADEDTCTLRMAVVSDIDSTLTTSDTEWLLQIAVPSHDAAMRPDANVLFQDYAALGYEVFYITARGSGLSLLDGTSARDATAQWLVDHGFPYNPDHLFLADGLGAWGSSAADYKTGILNGQIDLGFRFIYAYGNSDTDIEAFLNVGMAPENVFLVGDLAGGLGVSGVTNADAYTQHVADHMPAVPEATCPAE